MELIKTITGKYLTLDFTQNKILLRPNNKNKFDKDDTDRWLSIPTDIALAELLEDIMANSEYEFLTADHIRIGGLSEAPCIASFWYRSGDDEYGEVEELYYFDKYMTVNEVQELINGNTVTFYKA